MIFYNALQVFNEALTLLGESKLPDAVDTEATDAKIRTLAQRYESVRREVICAHPWNFARTRVSVVSGPSGDGSFLTVLPPDCLRVLSARGMRGEDAPHQTMREGILSDEPLSSVTYLADNDDPESWPTWVREVLVARLALEFARLVKGQVTEVRLQQGRYEQAFEAAKNTNAQEDRSSHQMTFAGEVMGLGRRRPRGRWPR